MTTSWSRRAALRAAAYMAAGAAAASQFLSAPAYAEGRKPDLDKLRKALRKAQERARQRREHSRTGAPSRNGWEMEKLADDRGSIYTRPVPGTPIEVQVRMGDVEIVFAHVISRFHYEVDTLRRGEVVGWRSPTKIRRALAESNQASGTAVQIRPGHYPPGVRGGFFPQEQLVVRDILAELGGVVRWGGDDRRPDEALFYIDVKPGDARLTQVADKVRVWNETPGAGAGAGVDVLSPARRKAAKKLEQRQKLH